MDVETNYISLSLPTETVRKLLAFTKARNGSVHNQAAGALEAGIAARVAEAPKAFQESYEACLKEDLIELWKHYPRTRT